MSKYQKRHYEDIADCISRLRSSESLTNKNEYINKEDLINNLIEMFQMDNINFNSSRFIEACRSVFK